jgi:myo-inositol-1(or 4)-monophosphatase
MAQTLSTQELEEIYVFALDLGRRAGKILTDGVDARCGHPSGRETKAAEEKMNAVDIVTQTDLGLFPFNPNFVSYTNGLITCFYTDVEAFVKDEITKKYPDHK